MSQRYDFLVAMVIDQLDGELLISYGLDGWEKNQERVAMFVFERTGLPLDRWDKLSKLLREPWLEKALDSEGATPQSDARPKQRRGAKPATVNQRMLEKLHADPTRVDWPASKWAEELQVTPTAVKLTQTWKKQIRAARAMTKADQALRRR